MKSTRVSTDKIECSAWCWGLLSSTVSFLAMYFFLDLNFHNATAAAVIAVAIFALVNMCIFEFLGSKVVSELKLMTVQATANGFIVISFVSYSIFMSIYSVAPPVNSLYGFKLGEVITEEKLSEMTEKGMEWQALSADDKKKESDQWTYQLTDKTRPETHINLYVHPEDFSLLRVDVIVGFLGDYHERDKVREVELLKETLEDKFNTLYDWPLNALDIRSSDVIRSVASQSWVRWFGFGFDGYYPVDEGVSWTDRTGNEQWLLFDGYTSSASDIAAVKLKIILQNTPKLDALAQEMIEKENQRVEKLEEQERALADKKVERIFGN